MLKDKQIVVFKSAAGFADRLRALTHCIQYCVQFNAALCVDWDEDFVWNLPFDEFFELEGVQRVSKAYVLRRIQQGAKLSKPWKITDLIHPIWVRADLFNKEYEGILTKPVIEKHEGEIIVTNGCGVFLYVEEVIVNNLRLKKDVVREMLPTIKKFNPEHIMVHLRGTDKASAKDYDEMKRQFRDFTKDTDDVACLVADSKELADDWIAEFPKSVLFRPNASVFKIPKLLDPKGVPRGSHLLFPQELKMYGVTKRQLALETMIDFLTLSFAPAALGRKESLFFETARYFGANKANQPFMCGWKPIWIHPDMLKLAEMKSTSGGIETSPSDPNASQPSHSQHPQDAQCHPPQEQQEQTPECPAP
jgi:hypothetical protein